MALADEVVVLSHGKIEDHGPPERVYLRPASTFAAGFMGDSNVIEGTVVTEREGAVEVDTALGRLSVRGLATAGTRVALSIRPEHLRPDDRGPVVLGDGRLRERHFSGMYQRCRVAVGDIDLLVFAPTGTRLDEGGSVTLSIDPQDVVMLRPAEDPTEPSQER